jgi:hypothetical protein
VINIFISYRREDSAGWVRGLSKYLVEHLGQEHIFIDVDTIAPGVKYREEIDKALDQCDVVLVIIGRSWLSVLKERSNRRIISRWIAVLSQKSRRRLESTEDFVRIEVSKALRRQIIVIPTLVDGAIMPLAGDLPDDLQSLAERNSYSISERHWDHDLKILVDFLEEQSKPSTENQIETSSSKPDVMIEAPPLGNFDSIARPYKSNEVNPPELPYKSKTDHVKKSTIGKENYSISLGDIVFFIVVFSFMVILNIIL